MLLIVEKLYTIFFCTRIFKVLNYVIQTYVISEIKFSKKIKRKLCVMFIVSIYFVDCREVKTYFVE